MKQFFLTIAGVFAGLMLFFVVLPILLIVSVAASASSDTGVPARSVLEIDLRQGLTDQAPTNPFAALGGGGLSVLNIVETLDQAEDDDRIKAVLIRLPEMGMSPAAADELRQAVDRFEASGKPIVAHSQGLYPIGASVSTYMLGASAGELWMSSTAQLGATGLSIDEFFLGRAFDRYGVQPEFEQRYEFKNAVNTFTQSDYTEAHRQAQTAWMSSIYNASIAAAAVGREMEAPALRAALESGPHSAEEARQLGLIDQIGEAEAVEASLLERAGDNAEILEFHEYASAVGERAGSGSDAIAIVGGEGAIVTGRTSADPFGGGSMIASDDTAEAIYDAIKDDAVKAIVFRVSSPGGSPEASEQILTAVRAAKAANKPVVVSMGDYAASGGYWISAEASAIVAQPSTLTGSIGVFGGKFVFDEALARFGVDMRHIAVGGPYADAFSVDQPFTDAQRQAFSGNMDAIYAQFLTRVSTGRDMTRDQVHEVARGRVWTGAQARRLGLVDEIGGLFEAVARAKQLAGIDADADVRFKRFPKPQSAFEALSEVFGVSGEAARALVAIGAVTRDPDAQAVLSRIRTERARAGGASVLADQPLG
ncbi:signal peptide peptidase SppA [Brevundimonas sp.]|uniref:signal peptide peptidase SppA n=1 Tax=Brevundimonas sp. TaxID=1871086 RepID=UPI0035B4282C